MSLLSEPEASIIIPSSLYEYLVWFWTSYDSDVGPMQMMLHL